MNRIISSVFTASALIFGVFLPSEEAVAQTAKILWEPGRSFPSHESRTARKPIILVPIRKAKQFSTLNGRFSILFIRSDVPKFTSNNREAGTPEENKAATQGGLAYFGTYSVGEADHTLNSHIEGSTFPNWRGADQKRVLELSGDELILTNP